MKSHVLILIMFLSCVFCGRNVGDESVSYAPECTVVESSRSESEDDGLDFKSVGILPARTAGYTGENNSLSTSVRSTNSGRRVQPSGKAPFRVIKEGKVIDRHNFHAFQTDLNQFPSGIHSSNRYIHSICQLLI